MIARCKSRRTPAVASQLGQAAILALLLVIGVGVTLFVYYLPTSTTLSIERDRKTAEALAQAKAALIGYAASAGLSPGRPGDLPCPDRDDNGFADVPADYPCNGAALGRLPWKTLGLPDLRDGDGERLWYAVSSNFKNNPRTPCASPGDPGCLNSDSRGTITVRDISGAVINDGSNPDPFTPSGVIAVIIAPGKILRRQGAAAVQIRGCTIGVDCDATERCTAPVTLTPKCDPANYLDILSGTEDNAVFTDGSNIDGFINGEVRDASGNVIINDRIITITYQDLMPLLERRVAREVFNCLTAYAAMSQNNGRYPWAAPVTNVTTPYADEYATRFGRIPDTLAKTMLGDPGGVADTMCPSTSPATTCMSASWPASCTITLASNWWYNWKELVFYGVAQNYRPVDPAPQGGVPAGSACGGTNCLLVDPPSSTVNKRVVVVIAGKRLSAISGGQPRTTNKQDPANYLEDTNVNTATSYTYIVLPVSATFNDFLMYQ